MIWGNCNLGPGTEITPKCPISEFPLLKNSTLVRDFQENLRGVEKFENFFVLGYSPPHPMTSINHLGQFRGQGQKLRPNTWTCSCRQKKKHADTSSFLQKSNGPKMSNQSNKYRISRCPGVLLGVGRMRVASKNDSCLLLRRDKAQCHDFYFESGYLLNARSSSSMR